MGPTGHTSFVLSFPLPSHLIQLISYLVDLFCSQSKGQLSFLFHFPRTWFSWSAIWLICSVASPKDSYNSFSFPLPSHLIQLISYLVDLFCSQSKGQLSFLFKFPRTRFSWSAIWLICSVASPKDSYHFFSSALSSHQIQLISFLVDSFCSQSKGQLSFLLFSTSLAPDSADQLSGWFVL